MLGEVGHGLPSSMQQKLALQTRNVIGFVGAREPFQITLSFRPYDIIPRSPPSLASRQGRGPPEWPPRRTYHIHHPRNAAATPIRSQNKQTPPEHGYIRSSFRKSPVSFATSPSATPAFPLYRHMYVHTYTYV